MNESTETSAPSSAVPGQQASAAREDLGRQRSGRPAWTESLLSGIGPLLGALIVLCAVLSFATDKFLSTSNLLNVLVQLSVVGIAAVVAPSSSSPAAST